MLDGSELIMRSLDPYLDFDYSEYGDFPREKNVICECYFGQ